MEKENKLLTEFYIKNVIATCYSPILNSAIKSESPDFVCGDYMLEIVSLVEEQTANLHFLFEKYKGLTIEKIPKTVFKAAGCDKKHLLQLSINGYFGIKNTKNELKFIFDSEKNLLCIFTTMCQFLNQLITWKS